MKRIALVLLLTALLCGCGDKKEPTVGIVVGKKYTSSSYVDYGSGPQWEAESYKIRLCDDSHPAWWVEVSKAAYSDLELGQRYEVKK